MADREREPTYEELMSDQAAYLSRDRHLRRANLRAIFNPGDYECMGERAKEGRCAKCGDGVLEDEPSVIRYHPPLPGGIFHARCVPTGPQWFGVDGDE